MANNEELLEEEEAYIMSLTNEDGEEEQFEYVATIEYQGDEYLILLPVNDDTQIVILKIVPVDEETENYVSVNDDDVLNAVYDKFKEEFKDVFTFED